MKSISKILVVLAGAAGLAAAVPFSAQAQGTGFYVKADAGGNITSDPDLKEFFGENTAGAKVKLDPGVRFGLDGGYQFCDWFAAEVELGGMANRVRSISGPSRVHDTTFANVPFLVNGRLQLPNRSPVKPYLGAGVGFSEAIIDADHLEFGNTFFTGSDSDTVFAWQAFAGLSWRLNERMELGVEYRYFCAESPRWHADILFGGPPFNDTLSFGRTQTHAISVAFTFQF
jgi:opacity protein-like surface antigen